MRGWSPFIVGDDVFFLNWGVMLLANLITMGICWCLAVFIAPLGMGYLYLYHSRNAELES